MKSYLAKPSERSSASLLAAGSVVMSFIVFLVHACWSPDALRGAPPAELRWETFENCPVLTEHVVDVPALESGILTELLVKENDSVMIDTPIARLDSEIAEMDLQVLHLQYKFAQYQATNNMTIDFYEFALREAQERLRRYQAVYESVRGQDIKDLELAVEKARVSLDQARQQRQEAIVEAELRAGSIRAAQMRLDRRKLKAPISGVVTEVVKHSGQWVEVGEPILRIQDLEKLVVELRIPLKQFNLAKIQGTPVRVNAQGLNGKSVWLNGTIASYDHSVSSQGLVRVHAQVNNIQQDGHWLILPGIEVTLKLAIPEDALIGKQAIAE